MKLYRVSLFSTDSNIYPQMESGDSFDRDGVEMVARPSAGLVERDRRWCETEAEAIRVAIPVVAQLHAEIESLLGRMYEGVIR